MTRALITGITGQDGSYLTELLLDKGYEVHGVVRRTSTLGRSRLDHLYSDPNIYGRRLFLHYAELDDPTTLRRVLVKVAPDEVYHLAGQSHVGLSFEIPESTCDMTAMGTLRLLEMIRDLNKPPRLFHASSSEVFGEPACVPQDEQTPFAPVNPYGCAKAFATQMVGVYRRTFGLFTCNGIMFNHESPRRGENFVTRKICRAAAAIKLGLQTELLLGDTKSRRDWGHARDYVQGMWLALQQETPEDFVFATGQLHSVQDIVEFAFGAIGLDWQKFVKQDPRFMRPVEPHRLVGNASKAERRLHWVPKTPFAQLIEEMTRCDLESLSAKESAEYSSAPPPQKR
ncbi:MAG: GDP-mannose 4,6-dehydratase [Verrucomicrobia bacterium]|nr:GDP-mannose 4,6-dehydratase [Verrucomicrobiota bacterium]